MRARPGDSYFETGGVRLRYRDEGRGSAVIFIHGWTLDLDQWDAQAAALAAEFRVVRWDRRGFGLSSGRPSIAADALDLLALYRHLGLDCAALVGMSQGARVVMQFAGENPLRAKCIVLDGPARFGTSDVTGSAGDIPYQRYRQLVRAGGLDAFRREWSEYPLVRLRSTDPDARALLARMIGRYPGIDLADGAPEAAATPGAAALESVDVPVLVMTGAFDLASRKEAARDLSTRLARVECIEIPDAGHLCNLDNPRVYNEELKRFLRRHTSFLPNP